MVVVRKQFQPQRYNAKDMPAMLPHQFDRLNAIMEVLGSAADRLPGNAPKFIKDQVERIKKWGADVRLSPKQIEWLENLYTQETGVTMRIMVDTDRADVLGDEGDEDDEDPSKFS